MSTVPLQPCWVRSAKSAIERENTVAAERRGWHSRVAQCGATRGRGAFPDISRLDLPTVHAPS